MNNRNGKTIINRGGAEVGKTKIAKTVNASFLGSYSYFQPGRANQYDLGTDNYNGLTDIPLYLAWMNEKNGGILYFPTNLKEKYQFYRYFYRSDAYVGAAIDLHTDLPMSKITLKMPPMNNIKRRNIIKKKYESMCEKLKLFTKLQSILFDYWVIGNVFVFCQYDPNLKEFVKLVILPPEDVNITKYPLSDDSLIVYNQEQVIELVKRLKSLNKDYSNFDLYLNDTSAELSEVDKRILSSIPDELLKYIFDNESINFDTDPYAGGELGSFCFHLARRKHEYATLGSSILERIFVPLMQKLHYTYTQWSLASRNMTPRNKITAPEISPEQLEQLREQFDMSMLTPEYSIITNYDWNWDIVGADNRLIDLGREYEVIENQIFAGLGVTREVLTGEGMYSSGHINVEIMNARYLLIRDIFKNMVEENLFKPIAKENGFYDVDEDGFTHYYYPKLSFERLSIIDNSENFDKMFNLYQKNSLPIGYIYEMLNIDEEEATEKLRKDMFTVKDATFNEMVREVYTRVGDSIVDETNIAELMTGSLFVNGTSVTMKNNDESDENDESSDDPFSTDDSMSNSEETLETNNDVEEDNKEKLKEKEIEKHSIELNDQDFEDFIKTQELVATDDEITEFLRNQNEVMIYNKDLKDFMNEYFLKPTNKDVDTFENLIDPEFHPTNTMFENFLEKRGIVTPSNKDIKDFFKLYFLKPTNDQIRKFLDRYKYISIEDEDVNKFIEDSKNNQVNNIKESQEMDDNHIDVMTATDDDLENYLSDQVGEDVTDNIIMNSKKIKKPFQI